MEQGAGSGGGGKEQRAKSKGQGAGSSKRRAFRYRLSVLGYQVDKGGAELPDQWPQDAASGGYSPRRIRPLADRLLVVGCDYDYEQEQEHEHDKEAALRGSYRLSGMENRGCRVQGLGFRVQQLLAFVIGG